MDTTAITNSDAIQAIANLTAELKLIWPIIMKLMSFVGFLLVATSVLASMSPQYTMMMRSAMGGLPNKMSLTLFGVGVLLIQIPTFLYHLSDTIFNNSSLSLLSYTALTTGVTQTGNLGVFLNFFVAVVMFVGLLSTIKGLIGYAAQGGNAQALLSTIMHLGFGAMCINCKLIMQAVGASLGGVYQSNIDKFF